MVETVAVVEEKFGPWLSQMKWLNFGGGHHITRPGYDIDALVSCVSRVQERYGVQVYLEPGEAVALNAGFLVSTVLDVLENSGNIAVFRYLCRLPYAGCAGNAPTGPQSPGEADWGKRPMITAWAALPVWRET